MPKVHSSEYRTWYRRIRILLLALSLLPVPLFRVPLAEAQLTELTNSIDATSEAHTADPYAAVGEIVRYRLVATLPEGTTENLQLSDLLPAGLLFLNDGTARLALVSDDAPMASMDPAGDSLGLGLGAGALGTPPWVSGSDPATVEPTFVLPDVNVGDDNSLSADNDVYASGTDPWFKLGSIVNADSDADGEYGIVEFNALVLNIAGNDAGVSRSNQSRGYVDGSQLIQSGAVSITIAEPAITNVAKSVNPVTGYTGSRVDFTITFSNANGAANTAAFNARVLDALPADLTYLGNVNVSGAGAWVDNSAGDTVDIAITEIVKGAGITVTYSATIDVSATPVRVITNTAALTYSSLPGANGSGLAGSTPPGAAGSDTGERDHSDGAGGVDDYTDDDDSTVTAENHSGYWTGAVSSDWSNGANWEDGKVPTGTVDVLIRPSSHTHVGNQPKVNIATAACQNLTIEDGASLEISTDGSILNVEGTYTQKGTGVISASNGGKAIVKGDIYKDATLRIAVGGTGGIEIKSSLDLP